MKVSILGILAGGHPAHEKIFRSFTDEVYFSLGPWAPGKRHCFFKKLVKYIFWGILVRLKNPSVVFIEGAMPSLVIGSILHFLWGNSYILALVAEDAFFKSQVCPNDLKSILLKTGFNKVVDAVIAIGPMIADQIKQFRFPGSVFLMYPEMNEKQFKRLMSSSYSAKNRSILHIGGGGLKYKGIDLTLRAAKRLRQYDFVILGYDYSSISGEISSNINLAGRVKDILPFLEKSALVIHPGRGDAFPVSTLEAMSAGVPVMLSKYTGTSCIMEEINPLFVREISVSDLVKGISWFFSLEEDVKIEYSNKIKRRVREELEKNSIENKKTILGIKSIIKTVLSDYY